jgi:hypothetical protein
MAVSGFVPPQGRRSAAVFYPLGHPKKYVYAQNDCWWFSNKKLPWPVRFREMLEMSVEKEIDQPWSQLE